MTGSLHKQSTSSLNDHQSEIDPAGERFDRVIGWLLIMLLAFMPLAFGAVQAWSEEVVVIFGAVISLCFLAKLIVVKTATLAWSWAYVPVVIFLLVAVLQLIPLPAALVGAISPNTLEMKRELLSDVPNAQELLQSTTMSFYPNSTKHDLRLVLAIAAVFFVVVNVFRRTDQIKRLLAAIAIIGGSIALLALAQDFFGNGRIYWSVPTGSGQAYSGPFINHSHYGQFMNLSMGAALGLVMVKLHEAFAGGKVATQAVSEFLTSRRARFIWLLVAVIIVGAATVFVSLSRGGMVSMLIAVGFTVVILTSRPSLRNRSWIIALATLGVFMCLLYMGFEAVYDRLATVRDLQEYEGRWQIVKDIAVAWTKFPVFGTGLGTHEFVYPMFDRSTTASLAGHAENEYAQTAEETGLAGLAALVVFGIIVWLNYLRNVKRTSLPVQSAAYGLGFGLLAVMLHSLSDFGQHLPANAALSAVSCALLLAIAHKSGTPAAANTSARAFRVPKGVSAAVLICTAGVWMWALIGANGARLAETRWDETLALEYSLAEKDWFGSDEEYIALISSAEAATTYEPDNAKYLHWLNVYRWRSMSRLTDPNTGEIRIPAEATGIVKRIADELLGAAVLCPTYGPSYCVAGQLRKSVLNDPAGADLIEKGYRLAPCDPTACFVAGVLDVEQGRIEASFGKLARAATLNGGLFREVANIYANQLERPDLALEMAGDNTGRLSYVAGILDDTGENKELVEQVRNKVVESLEQRCNEPDAPASVFASLAAVYVRRGDGEKAIEYYRRALSLKYDQVRWRLSLARLLAETGSVREALREARICLRLNPELSAAKGLIADLSVHPEVLQEKAPGS